MWVLGESLDVRASSAWISISHAVEVGHAVLEAQVVDPIHGVVVLRRQHSPPQGDIARRLNITIAEKREMKC